MQVSVWHSYIWKNYIWPNRWQQIYIRRLKEIQLNSSTSLMCNSTSEMKRIRRKQHLSKTSSNCWTPPEFWFRDWIMMYETLPISYFSVKKDVQRVTCHCGCCRSEEICTSVLGLFSVPFTKKASTYYFTKHDSVLSKDQKKPNKSFNLISSLTPNHPTKVSKQVNERKWLFFLSAEYELACCSKGSVINGIYTIVCKPVLGSNMFPCCKIINNSNEI